ncbi:MAG: hypothetical protein MUE58_07300 [Chitinophagaceae bacterium]|nr:hypothetical protein [Chitinophagaceae bacterium]
MRKEEFLHELMRAVDQQGNLPIYDFTADRFTTESEIFSQSRLWANQLVRDKLARYVDPEHTILQLTNFGRYWAIKGGYLIFLKDSQREKEMHSQQSKEELIEARLRLTHYRLWGFWLSLIISLIGFVLSLFNLYLILGKGLSK